MALYRNKVTAERREFYVDPGQPWSLIGIPASITSTDDITDGALGFIAAEIVLAMVDSSNSTSSDDSTPDFSGGGGDFGGGGSDASW